MLRAEYARIAQKGLQAKQSNIFAPCCDTQFFARHHGLRLAWYPCSFFFFTPECTQVIFKCLLTCFWITAHFSQVCSYTLPSFLTRWLLHMLDTTSVLCELPPNPLFFHLHVCISLTAHFRAAYIHGGSVFTCALSLITSGLHVSVTIPFPSLMTSAIIPSLHFSVWHCSVRTINI